MIIEIQHETRLEYSETVSEWLAELRMQPVTDEQQSCHSFHLAVSQPTNVFWYLDGFGNRVHHFNLLAPHQQIRVLAASVVETGLPQRRLADSTATFPLTDATNTCDVLDFLPYRGPVHDSPRLQTIRGQLAPPEGCRVGDWIEQVGRFFRDRFEYERGVTDSTSTIDHLLETGKGVCQDFAHLMIAVLRSYGVPARYVSGYIHRPDKDSQSHAWCEVWLPDVGWLGYDPTNCCEATDWFVRVAIGRDYTDVPPNRGTHRGEADEKICVRVATRELPRLPSLAWHEHLQPLDVPTISMLRPRHGTLADEQHQQQQQQQ
ncbi:MAG: transglutaminase domain-containing protein [Pirellulales bacterium]